MITEMCVHLAHTRQGHCSAPSSPAMPCEGLANCGRPGRRRANGTICEHIYDVGSGNESRKGRKAFRHTNGHFAVAMRDGMFRPFGMQLTNLRTPQ